MIRRHPSQPQLRELDDLRERCSRLEERLGASDALLRERSERLYEIQQHYSSEHFSLQESMRSLQTERWRNAGLNGQFQTAIERAKALQSRIQDLKTRLRRYETVNDEHFDEAPIFIETPAHSDEG